MKTKTISKEDLNQLGTDALAGYFKELRFSENITQLEVSNETGLHRNTIINVEKSKNFTMLTLFKLADFYRISPSELLSIIE